MSGEHMRRIDVKDANGPFLLVWPPDVTPLTDDGLVPRSALRQTLATRGRKEIKL